MRSWCILLGGVLAAGVAASGMAADWPAFRGPMGNGVSAEKGINKQWGTRGPQVIWTVPLGDEGHSGPSVAGGKVFMMDHAGEEDLVRCLDLATGKEQWSYRYRDERAMENGFTRATPCVADGRVYTVSRMGKVHCLDVQTGEVIWRKDMERDFGSTYDTSGGYASSPVVEGGNVILYPGGRGMSVVALKASSGERVWAAGDNKQSFTTPLVATINGQRQCIVVSERMATGYQCSTGRVLWSFPGEAMNMVSPVVNGNALYTAGLGTGTRVMDIRPGGPAVRWYRNELQQEFSTPISWQGKLYGVSQEGDLFCANWGDGRTTWRQPGFKSGGMVAVDGVLLVMAGDVGEMAMVELNPVRYHELGRMKVVEPPAWAAPAVADGKVLVRGKDALVCLELRE